MKNKIILLTLVAAMSGLTDTFAAEPPNFKSADKNSDGKLSPGEFAAADAGRKGDENTKQMFTKIDTDSDGFISPNEFAPYRVRRGDTTKKPEKKTDKKKKEK
jgi:Ca2+-binding EF-hand superfamily protein